MRAILFVMAKQGRMGGRGCPRCGSHNTWGLGRSGVQVCDACDYRWAPCSDNYCRGYRIEMKPIPSITGCPDCDADHGGVPDHVVQFWPEAWRAIARHLDEHKMDPVVPVTIEPS